MKKAIAGIILVLGFLSAAVGYAQEFPIHGSNASGRAGERVFLELTYDYGASFQDVVEDLALDYPSQVLTFRPDASIIDMFNTSRTLIQHAAVLLAFAQANGGNVVANAIPLGLPDGIGGYRLSFYTTGAAQLRSGVVRLQAAFDIHPNAAPGDYKVSFGADNVLVDTNGSEFSYPADLQNLQISVLATAVPEAPGLTMLLAGLALIGTRMRRRRARGR